MVSNLVHRRVPHLIDLALNLDLCTWTYSNAEAAQQFDAWATTTLPPACDDLQLRGLYHELFVSAWLHTWRSIQLQNSKKRFRFVIDFNIETGVQKVNGKQP